MFRLILYINRLLLRFKGFTFSVLSNKSDIEKSNLLRIEIFSKELGWNETDKIDHTTLFDDLESISQFIACKNKDGEIIASVRLTPARFLSDSALKKYYEQFSLFLFPEWLLDRTYLVTRFCIKKSYRKSTISFFLIEAMVNFILQNDAIVGLGYCSPNLYPLYEKIGFKIYTAIKKIRGSFLCYLYLDTLMLKKSKYFKYRNLPITLTDIELDWLHNFHHYLQFLPTNLSTMTNLNLSGDLFKGISRQGIGELFTNSVTIKYKQGDIVADLSEEEYTIGIVKSGVLKVVIGNLFISFLQPNEVMGEVSYLLHQGRTATLISTMDSEIVFLTKNFPDKLSNVDDKVLLWKNLSWILANRLSSSNEKLIHDNNT